MREPKIFDKQRFIFGPIDDKRRFFLKAFLSEAAREPKQSSSDLCDSAGSYIKGGSPPLLRRDGRSVALLGAADAPYQSVAAVQLSVSSRRNPGGSGISLASLRTIRLSISQHTRLKDRRTSGLVKRITSTPSFPKHSVRRWS